MASVDVKYLGNIERGRENPTIGTLEKLAGALSVKVHQLLDFQHEIEGKRLLLKRIGHHLNMCDEKDLRIVLRLVRAIKD